MHKGIVVVTGVGLREAKVQFKAPDPAVMFEHHGKKCKLNAAAGAAIELNKAGYLVYMTGSCEDCLEKVAHTFMKMPCHWKKADLLNKTDAQDCAKDIQKLKTETNLDVHLVHYGGASETKVKLPDDNLFLSPWDTPSDAIAPIVSNNTVTWLNMLQALKDIFHSQKMTKVILISAITAIRTKRLHMLDAIQKGAGHAMARSLALDLTKENIFVTEVMPGITDTGFYDNPTLFEAIVQASKEFGYEYTQETFPVFSPQRIGEAVVFALQVNAHVRELSLMPYGQYPHLGA